MTSLPRLAIVGLGKMGRAISRLAAEHGWSVVAEIGSAENPGGRGITCDSLRGADVAVEFTTARSAPANVRACARAGCPVVVGTTGWDAERPAVERAVLDAGGAMFCASNFSPGVHAFLRMAECAARIAAKLPAFDAHIVETHHASKRDAPSGTARELSARVGGALRLDVSTSSIRTGMVPGTHDLIFDGLFEQIRLVHVVRDRRVFADGALTAARWLLGRRGVFGMSDMLDGLDPA